MRSLFAAFAVLASLTIADAARAEDLTDLRGVKVGMSIKDMPAEGYRELACAGPAGKALTAWSDWKTCSPDAAGLRALKAGYDQPGTEGTFIAGHPVNLTLFFDAETHLKQVTIETDPKARLYMRKKAYLLGQQAKYRYGENRWDCKDAKPTADEEPLGPTFIKEHCTKTLNDREVVIDRSLFRKVGSDPKGFTSQSRVSVIWRGKAT